MILKYYSENIRIPDFSPNEEKEIMKILVAVDFLVFGDDSVTCSSDESLFSYQKDGLVITAESDGEIIEYRVGLIAEEDSCPVEVFCAILSDRSSSDPVCTITRHNSGTWVSKLWSIAMKEDSAMEAFERFSRI